MSTLQQQVLVGLERGREIVFPDKTSAPSQRTFAEWKARRYFPTVKIGRRVFCDPDQVRAALERRFRINANPA